MGVDERSYNKKNALNLEKNFNLFKNGYFQSHQRKKNSPRNLYFF